MSAARRLQTCIEGVFYFIPAPSDSFYCIKLNILASSPPSKMGILLRGPAMKLKTEGARTLLAYWERQKGEGRLPSSTDLDLVDLAPILSNIVLYEHEANDFTVRFFGTEMVRRLGVDPTGTKVSAGADDPFVNLIIDHLGQVITGPAILAWEYHAQTNEGPLLDIEQIMLPWANEAGEASCILTHIASTSGEDATLTLTLEESFRGQINLQTVTL